MSASVDEVSKLECTCGLTRKGSGSCTTVKEKQARGVMKRLNSNLGKKDSPLPELQRNSLTTKPENKGQFIINEKIRFILQDTDRFSRRIASFSGTTTDDKEYLDIEDVLFFNLIELVQIRTDNVKVKREKLNAISAVQEKIKQLDSKLEENFVRAAKRIGNNANEEFNKSQSPQKQADQIVDEVKNKRKRLHFQATKHSIQIPLVDEINKVKTSLKSCGETKQHTRSQIMQSLAQLNIAEDNNRLKCNPSLKEEPKGRATKKLFDFASNEEINKVKHNLQAVEKLKKVDEATGKNLKLKAEDKLQVSENSFQVTLRDEINKIKSNLQSLERSKARKGAVTSVKSVSVNTEQENKLVGPVQGERKTHLEQTPEIQTIKASHTNTTEISKANTPEVFCPNLNENRKFSLVQVLSSQFLFRRKISVTNTLRIIQNCLQEAQHHFEHFKGNFGQRELMPNLENKPAITAVLKTPLIAEKASNGGVSEIDTDRKISSVKDEAGKGVVKPRGVGENTAQVTENRRIPVLLMQIRCLLFVMVMKLMQAPYEVVVILFMALWLWERQ